MDKPDETPRQLERLSELIGTLEGENLTAYCQGIEVWLNGRFMPGATPEWRNASRYSQAAQYISWLEQDRF